MQEKQIDRWTLDCTDSAWSHLWPEDSGVNSVPGAPRRIIYLSEGGRGRRGDSGHDRVGGTLLPCVMEWGFAITRPPDFSEIKLSGFFWCKLSSL